MSVRGYYSPESKSVSLQAMREAGKEPFPKFYTDSKQEGEVSFCMYHLGYPNLSMDVAFASDGRSCLKAR